MVAQLFSASKVSFGQNAMSVQIGKQYFVVSTLPFNMQPQTQTNWCWAATATSVSHFYYSASAWTQCLVANGELSRGDCCAAPVPSPCNVPWYLDRALQRTSNFQSMVSGTIAYNAINAEIAAGRVIGTRIGWNGGGGHFMVIYGCSVVGGVQYVDIDDPIYGKSHLTLTAFANNYKGSGKWTHTYYTKKYPTLKIKLPPFDVRLAGLVEEHRPLLALKRGEAEFAVKPETSLAVPHHVYVLGLDDVARGDFVSPQRPASLRVFEMENGRSRSVFEFTPSDRDTPQLESMSDDAATLDGANLALLEVTRITEHDEQGPELSLLRIPALYVEAYWLHYLDGAKDVFIPVRALGLFSTQQAVPAREFFEKVRTAARERQQMSADPAIAP